MITLFSCIAAKSDSLLAGLSFADNRPTASYVRSRTQTLFQPQGGGGGYGTGSKSKVLTFDLSNSSAGAGVFLDPSSVRLAFVLKNESPTEVLAPNASHPPLSSLATA